ncbi:MAG: AI-2E family transporter [Candidatus Moranbacteria bacterium]|nr:AI-2E family transporter [Candidatus Moranbacteria bacterium]
MELKNLNTYFFFLILLGISGVTFFIFEPFIMAILLAAVFAVIFQRPYKFFVRITGGRSRISALLTSVFGIIIFAGLFFGIAGLIATEAANLFQNSVKAGDAYLNYVDPIVNNVNKNPLLKSFGLENLINSESVSKAVSQLGQGAFGILQKTYQGVAHFLFLAVVMFFTLYYFLVGGRTLVKKLMFLSPLRDSHEKLLIEKFISISRATMKGTLVVGIVQGSIGGITFALVGVPSAIAWGIVMSFLSLIPMFGTSLIWFPAGVIMLLIGNIWQGVVILAVGLGIISIIDNFLRPELVGKDTQMHPLVVFFATLGGISLLGFLGFIIGPIIVALFLTLWNIYAVEFKGQLTKYNT